MSWATSYIADLKAGKTVKFRPRGQSMSGKIESGQLVTVEPVEPKQVKKGDIVLCKVNGFDYLHIVKAVQGHRFQIGNNHGKINGWTVAVYGKLISVEP
jgi:SOS-response transcriptional repressor LexA